jgi:hypothetical protein
MDHWLESVDKYYHASDVIDVKLDSLGAAIVALAKYRLEYVITRLVASIGAVSADDGLSVGFGSGNEFERTLYVIGLACRCFECEGEGRTRVDRAVITALCDAVLRLYHQNHLAWADTPNGRSVATQCMSAFTLLSKLYQSTVLEIVKKRCETVTENRAGSDVISTRLTCIAHLHLNVNGLIELLDIVNGVFSMVVKETANNSLWCRRVIFELSNPLAACVRTWVGQNRDFLLVAHGQSDHDPSSSARKLQGAFSRSVQTLISTMVKCVPTGSRKRGCMWPTLVLLACLVPAEWKEVSACESVPLHERPH